MTGSGDPATFESAEALHGAAQRLIDAWCDRRQLGVLHMMLGGYLALNGLTDGWGQFYDALRNIRSLYGPALPAEERVLIDRLARATEKIVYRDVRPGGERPQS